MGRRQEQARQNQGQRGDRQQAGVSDRTAGGGRQQAGASDRSREALPIVVPPRDSSRRPRIEVRAEETVAAVGAGAVTVSATAAFLVVGARAPLAGAPAVSVEVTRAPAVHVAHPAWDAPAVAVAADGAGSEQGDTQ